MILLSNFLARDFGSCFKNIILCTFNYYKLDLFFPFGNTVSLVYNIEVFPQS
eukprot:04751.XXX_30257_30412_1 [CDS] Oithona nana genome sequencing.